LIEHRGAALSREELLNCVWKYDTASCTRTVDVHIAWLRQKLEDNPKPPLWIQTFRGLGYKFTAWQRPTLSRTVEGLFHTGRYNHPSGSASTSQARPHFGHTSRSGGSADPTGRFSNPRHSGQRYSESLANSAIRAKGYHYSQSCQAFVRNTIAGWNL
jgi:Transcriptional regulatory protein, C terminal